MEFDYNHIFLDNRQLTNKAAMIWCNIIAAIFGIVWVLYLLQIVNIANPMFAYLAPVCVILLVLPTVLHKIFSLSDASKVSEKHTFILALFILGCCLLTTFIASCCLSSYIMAAWLLPLVIACQYYSKKTTAIVYAMGLLGMLAATFITGAPVTEALPYIMIYCAFFPLFMMITKRTSLLLKKQKLSIMALQAKQNLDNMHEFPDTFLTDCKIKMHYLAKNGIDIDAALEKMGGNVEKYNDFVLTFLGESNRKEDELFSLLTPDTILQYGAKVRSLRIKANALGLTQLTDTAFFHEIEAYANSFEVVRLNWEKLSFEWDEACEVFTAYIRSLGLKNHATDENGNQITFKEWGEHLQEAFDALEIYDTKRARSILNELLRYQIDSDITKNLQSIVANIDEILKA
ncbi:MAG: hypothetical protein IJ326_13000 [Lachnospiraceae bacterium]|nr:hypothetical protein [Lachnospiraceae bacterium]